MMEKDEIGPKDHLPPSPDAAPVYGEAVATQGGLGRRIFDSFRRDPNAHVSVSATGGDGKSFDIEHAAQKTATSPLQRKLKGRHLQMIAIGGSIGMDLISILSFLFSSFLLFLLLFLSFFSTPQL